MIAFFETIASNWPDWWPRLRDAAWVTIYVTVISFILAFVVGLALEFLRTRRSAALRRAAGVYILVLRGVPILVVLYLLYFALPQAGIVLNAIFAGILGLGAVHGAYLAEVFRAGLRTVAPGQREAALAVGLTPLQTFVLILFPQAIRVVLPPLLISLISLLKDSAICALIAVPELTLTARAIMAETFLPMHVFILVGAFYFGIAFPASLFVRSLERRLRQGRVAKERASSGNLATVREA
ncbi:MULTISPECIES: amino acid ABC transporter permease [unclassified Mesorhizobium]|uniref:amino acid ABC transporter permease n=1 Tax=unclassified Mesorhizobium TaxID=325217 RepID=UPI001CCE1A86|nr:MULTISPECIES: amino acid ABC transporter permease [unclassified Mesorhizobium]MBZ9742224.1 amino acid ABC transporter permease [Mesorhizobium sp. CO1-1-4]MBZ9805828.1 amino acid ABC transporter permease [Mesorhizobium sp. ES1-6]